MFTMLPKHSSNMVLGFLGIMAVTHSLLHFGTGEMPEAILSLLLIMKAVSGRRQPWAVAAVGTLALVLTWSINSGHVIAAHFGGLLSWISITLFALLAFSQYVFERSPKGSDGMRH